MVLLSAVAARPSNEELQRQIDELRQIVKEQQKEIEAFRKQAGIQQPTKQPAPAIPVATPSGEKTDLYGFLRLDAILDSSLTNNGQIPFFVLSPDNLGKGSNGNSAFTMHPRLTRLGLNFAAPSDLPEGWKTTGKFEIDWQNGSGLTVESRPLPRIRHAYIQMQRGSDVWLLGQTWDLISPLFPSPNDDTLMWNAGNMGDRRPQIRFSHDPKNKPFTWAVALGLTGAIDAKDLDDTNADGKPDGNGVRDGEDSALPNIQARLAWKWKQGSVGLWAHHAWERLTKPIAGSRRFTSHSVGLDWQQQIFPGWDVRGELWTGRNLSDFRGGIGQGINTARGSEIHSQGGWLEVGRQISPRHRLALGYTTDDPKDSDIPEGGRTKNTAWYLHSRWKLSTNVEIGLNYLYWITKWRGMATGTDHRIDSFIQHHF